MSAILNIFLTILACVVVFATVTAAATKRQAGEWNYYHFDGQGFTAGPSTDGSPFVAVRNRKLPVIVTSTEKIESAPMPPGKGVIAGICYMQSSGGKLVSRSEYAPYARMPVRILSGGEVVATVETDDHGYFMAALAAGRYSVNCGIAADEVMLEKETTILVPLRGSKRMVD